MAVRRLHILAVLSGIASSSHAPSSPQLTSPLLWPEKASGKEWVPSTGASRREWRSLAVEPTGIMTNTHQIAAHMRREPSQSQAFGHVLMDAWALDSHYVPPSRTSLLQRESPHNQSALGHNGSAGSSNQTALDTPEEERQRETSLALVVFPVAVVLAILFEIYHFAWSEVDWTIQMDRSDGQNGSELVDNSFNGLTVGIVQRAISLGRIYFSGAGRIKGKSYVTMLFCHNLFGQYLGLVNFNFQRRFWNLYEHPSMALFLALIVNWVILYTVMSLTAVYSAYTEGMLKIHWRDHMTRYFETIWLPNSYAFKLKDDRRFDNPDQRITEDINGYVQDTYGMTLGLWNAVVGLGIYGYMLFTLSPTSFFGYCNVPGWLFYVALAYAALGSFAMHYLGADLAHFSWLGERYGGDFRSELRRIFDQSETVAAVRSQDAELGRLQSRFEHIKLITWKSMILNKRLNWFNHFYGPFSSILFMCILMPFFIRGEVDLGRIKQCEMALGQVSASLTFFVNNYGGLASYRAVVDRLHNFRCTAIAYMKAKQSSGNSAMDLDEKLLAVLADRGRPEKWPQALGGLGKQRQAQASISLASAELFDSAPPYFGDERNVLELKQGNLSLPSGEALLRDVNLRVTKGTSVLLCGKEGAGKSTLLRALAGIWPYMSAASQQGADDTVLINQKPRLPTVMSLRDAVTFPKEPGTFTDKEIVAALHLVKLSELAESDLGVAMDANTVLSGGEFQRLMVAHCLLAKPRWVLLDESMAHLSRENQLAMYELLRSELVVKSGCGIVSTSHDWRFLAHFHDYHYMIEADLQDCGGAARPVGKLVAFEPDSQAAEISPPSTDSIEMLRAQLTQREAEVVRLRKELAIATGNKKEDDQLEELVE